MSVAALQLCIMEVCRMVFVAAGLPGKLMWVCWSMVIAPTKLVLGCRTKMMLAEARSKLRWMCRVLASTKLVRVCRRMKLMMMLVAVMKLVRVCRRRTVAAAEVTEKNPEEVQVCRRRIVAAAVVTEKIPEEVRVCRMMVAAATVEAVMKLQGMLVLVVSGPVGLLLIPAESAP